MRYLPWVVSVVLAALLAINWQQSRQEISAKNTEISELHAQYETLRSEANSKLEQAANAHKALVQEANEKLASADQEAREKLAEANQREVQVNVRFRKALLSSGSVAVISNRAGEAVAYVLDVERPSNGQRRTIDVVIDAGQTKELGEREGWAFLPGDTLKISQAGRKALVYSPQ